MEEVSFRWVVKGVRKMLYPLYAGVRPGTNGWWPVCCTPTPQSEPMISTFMPSRPWTGDFLSLYHLDDENVLFYLVPLSIALLLSYNVGMSW